jgi:hypothetical protein
VIDTWILQYVLSGCAKQEGRMRQGL